MKKCIDIVQSVKSSPRRLASFSEFENGLEDSAETEVEEVVSNAMGHADVGGVTSELYAHTGLFPAAKDKIRTRPHQGIIQGRETLLLEYDSFENFN